MKKEKIYFTTIKNNIIYHVREAKMKLHFFAKNRADKEMLISLGFYGKVREVIIITAKDIVRKILQKKRTFKLSEIKEAKHFLQRNWERKIFRWREEKIKLKTYLRNITYPFRRKTFVIFFPEFLKNTFNMEPKDEKPLCLIIEKHVLKTGFWIDNLQRYIQKRIEEGNFIIIK